MGRRASWVAAYCVVRGWGKGGGWVGDSWLSL